MTEGAATETGPSSGGTTAGTLPEATTAVTTGSGTTGGGTSTAATTSTTAVDVSTGESSSTSGGGHDLGGDGSSETGSSASDTSASDTSGGDTSGGDTSSGGESGNVTDCDPNDMTRIACYDFEPPQQQAILDDVSFYDNDGEAFGVVYSAGYDGQAVTIMAASTIEVINSQSLNPAHFSITAWVRLAGPPMAKAGVVQKEGQFALNIGTDRAPNCTAGGDSATGVPLPLDEWVHLACIHGENEFKLMVNGVIAAGIFNVLPAVPGGPSSLRIGCGGPGCQNVLVGAEIDRLRLWNVAIDEMTLCAEGGCP